MIGPGGITEPQRAALKWLRDHGGSGCFDKNGVLLAGGELAPFMRSTFNTLRQLGFVEFIYAKTKPTRVVRIAVTAAGDALDVGFVAARRPVELNRGEYPHEGASQ